MTAVTSSSLEHAIGVEGLLAIRLRDGEVRLRAVDGDVVRVHDRHGHDLAEMFDIDAASGSLALKVGRGLEVVIGPRSLRRGHGRYTPDLEIDLPRRATLVVETASGEVRADGLSGDQRYRAASGGVVLRAVSGRIEVDAISGDIGIGAIGAATVATRSMSGDIAIRAATLSALQVTTTSGDIEVAGRLVGPGPFTIDTVSGDGLLAPAGDVRIEMASMAGDLTSELDGPAVTERGRRSLAVGSGGPLVTFRSMSGDLRVVRPIRAEQDGSDVVGAFERPGEPDRFDQPPPNTAIAAAYDEARLRILRSLERGEIDVAEAGRRLETLDAGDVAVRSASGLPSDG
jgi:hypothetical protein